MTMVFVGGEIPKDSVKSVHWATNSFCTCVSWTNCSAGLSQK